MAALAEDYPDFPASFVLSRKGTPLLMDAHNHKYIAKDFANMKPKAFMDMIVNTLTR
jgi:hypothetical protein